MLAARTTFFLRGAIVAMLLLAGGCETMPVQEMSDARQAIMAARDAGAAEHASDELMAAQSSLESAEKHLSARNYAVARREAVDAKTQAIDALRISEAARGELD